MTSNYTASQPGPVRKRARLRDQAFLSPAEDPEFDTPGQSLWLFDIFTHWQLFRMLLRKNTATRYYGSVLGWLWSYIRPAMQFLMYYFVIGMVLGVDRNIELFPIYLFSGLIVINLFREGLQGATESVTGNAPLIRKIYFPRELFPVTAVCSALIHFLPQVVVLIIVILIAGWKVSLVSIGLFLLGTTIIFCFTLGLGLIFGAINVSFRDAKSIVGVFLMFAMWSSPVLYSWEMIRSVLPAWLYNVYLINPVTTAVELFHAAFWMPLVDGASMPDHLTMYTYAGLCIALGTLIAGQLVFRAKEADFAQSI